MEKKEVKGVRLEGITKIYQDPKTGSDFAAVDDVSIDIAPGNFATLLGPSGCGKTTILRMISGFESPDKGEIYLGSEKINSLTLNKRDTAMVFQSYALLPHYNVFNNVAYGLKLIKPRLSSQEIRERVMNMLDLVELSGMEARMTNQLSGGQQQRVALARALVMQPGVLLFDEPLSNLDARLRVTMRTEIRKIQQRLGITAVYVTHDQAEAMSLSDEIILMNKGRIAQKGTPQDIYYKPASEFVADFIGEVSFLEGKVKSVAGSECVVDVEGSEIKVESFVNVSSGDLCKIVIRPESAHLSDAGDIPCEIVFSTFMGAYQYYQVRASGALIKINDYNPRGRRVCKAGEKSRLAFDSKSIHLI